MELSGAWCSAIIQSRTSTHLYVCGASGLRRLANQYSQLWMALYVEIEFQGISLDDPQVMAQNERNLRFIREPSFQPYRPKLEDSWIKPADIDKTWRAIEVLREQEKVSIDRNILIASTSV